MENNCRDPEEVKVEAEVEEGEISDSASVEEISEEAFNIKQAPPLVPPSPSKSAASSGGSGARVWMMRDLYKYQIPSKPSYLGLYNLAWAQAVNNKPLGDVLVMMEDGSNDNSNPDTDSSSVKTSDGDENKVVIDVEDDGEKEEGELEEGEIDLDSELVVKDEDKVLDVKSNKETECQVRDDPDRRKRVDLVMEELVNLNAADAQK